jgi:CRP-like cAMP-binding protein
VVFKAGEVILKEGEEADKFYLIRSGHVAIYINKPSEIIIQTIHEGDILGWSWLIPPYRYRFSAKAVENTRALALDGKCLRGKCEKNSDLGYELLKRIVTIFTARLEATRLQLLDIYNIRKE